MMLYLVLFQQFELYFLNKSMLFLYSRSFQDGLPTKYNNRQLELKINYNNCYLMDIFLHKIASVQSLYSNRQGHGFVKGFLQLNINSEKLYHLYHFSNMKVTGSCNMHAHTHTHTKRKHTPAFHWQPKQKSFEGTRHSLMRIRTVLSKG